MKEIIFASHNKGKIAEIRQILSPFGIKVFSSDDFDLPDVEETGTTFEENAIIKASAIAKIKGVACLADDSGLCVNALNGRPGVYSARYAVNRDFDKAMDRLIKEIDDTKSLDRTAYFSCVLALVNCDGTYRCFEGRVDGTISNKKLGEGGFGFDPVFVPDGYDKSFAQLGSEIKNKISHRGRALEKFIEYIKTVK